MILRLKHCNTCPSSIALIKSAHKGRTNLPCPKDSLNSPQRHMQSHHFCWFTWPRWPPGWHQQYLHLCALPFHVLGAPLQSQVFPPLLLKSVLGASSPPWISPSAPASAVRGGWWWRPVLPIWTTGAFCFAYSWSLFLKLAFYSSGKFFQHLSWSVKSTADIPSSYNYHFKKNHGQEWQVLRRQNKNNVWISYRCSLLPPCPWTQGFLLRVCLSSSSSKLLHKKESLCKPSIVNLSHLFPLMRLFLHCFVIWEIMLTNVISIRHF